MRDLAYETLVLNELIKEVARQTGEDVTSFIDRVSRRIEHGSTLYGDLAFLEPGRDNLREKADEDADSIAYTLFALHKLNLSKDETPEGVHQLLFESMVHAAIADLKARQARWRLQDR